MADHREPCRLFPNATLIVVFSYWKKTISLNPNGELVDSSEESNPQFLINILAENGVYTINLYDNKKKKDLKLSKNFLVKAIRGRLYIKCWSMVDRSFSAYVDGQFIGNDSSGELEVFIPTGLKYIEVYGRFDTIRKTKEIIEGSSNNNNIHF